LISILFLLNCHILQRTSFCRFSAKLRGDHLILDVLFLSEIILDAFCVF